MIWYVMILRDMIWYIWHDMLYLLTAIGLPPGVSSTVHIYTQTAHRTTKDKQYIEKHKKIAYFYKRLIWGQQFLAAANTKINK